MEVRQPSNLFRPRVKRLSKFFPHASTHRLVSIALVPFILQGLVISNSRSARSGSETLLVLSVGKKYDQPMNEQRKEPHGSVPVRTNPKSEILARRCLLGLARLASGYPDPR